jgi:ubiquinone biosynthesis protein UbiJ
MNNIPVMLLPVAEDLVNRVLRLDGDTLDRLGDMDGKIICFQYQQQGEALHTIYMLPFAGGLRLRMDSDGQDEVDVTISGNLPAFVRLLFGETSASNMSKADMQIRGDIYLGQNFKEIMDKLDLDLAGQLAKLVGDGPAHHLGLMARDWRNWKKNAAKTFAQDFAEYIQEERQLSPRPEEVDGLLDGIDELRSGVDRLASRLTNLKEKIVS